MAFNEHLGQMKCTGYIVVGNAEKKDVPDRFAQSQKAQLVGMTGCEEQQQQEPEQRTAAAQKGSQGKKPKTLLYGRRIPIVIFHEVINFTIKIPLMCCVCWVSKKDKSFRLRSLLPLVNEKLCEMPRKM